MDGDKHGRLGMRRQTVTILSLTTAGLAVFLIILVLLRNQTTLIQAIAAFGQVAAAVFAALAGFAAMRAAIQSDLTASRAREALGRTLKPSMHASISQDPSQSGQAVGSIGPGQDRGATDVVGTWHRRDGRTVSKDVGELVPEPSGRNPHLPYQMPIGPWLGTPADTLEKVVVEYSDLSRVMKWRLVTKFPTQAEWIASGRRAEDYHPAMTGVVISDEPIA